MSSEKHTTEIEVNITTASAEAAVERVLAKLNKAANVADGLGIGDGGPQGSQGTSSAGSRTTTSSARPALPHGAPAGSSTTSSAGAGALPTLPGGGSGGGGGGGGGGGQYGPARPDTGRGSREQERWNEQRERAIRRREWEASKVPPAEPPPPQHLVRDAAMQQAQGGAVGAVGALATASSGAAGMLTVGAGAARGAGKAAGAIGKAEGTPLFKRLGMAGMALGGLSGAGMALGAASYGARMGAIGERAGLEEGELQALRMGGGGVPRNYYNVMSDTWGADPQEALQMMVQGTSAVGMRQWGGTKARTLVNTMFAAKRSGMSPGSISSMAATYGAGGGSLKGLNALGELDRMTLGLTESMDISGSRADEVLSALVGAIGARAGSGRMADSNKMAAFTLGLHKTGISEVRGTGAARATARMMGYGTSAAQSFGSNFAGLGQAALLAEAFQGGGSIEQIMARLDEQGQSPQAVRQAYRNQLGGAAKYALYGEGESARSARGILAADPTEPSRAWAPSLVEPGDLMSLRRAQARRAARRVDGVDVAQGVQLIGIAEDMEAALMAVTRGPAGQKFTEIMERIARYLAP